VAVSFHQSGGAQIGLSDVRVRANNQNKTCAQKSYDNDLQVRLTVSAIQGMIHSRLRFFKLIAIGASDLLGHAAFVDVGERWVSKWAEGRIAAEWNALELDH
jgi:hypothetical protein